MPTNQLTEFFMVYLVEVYFSMACRYYISNDLLIINIVFAQYPDTYKISKN